MHKIVYNNCYGGFSLSMTAVEWLGSHCTDSELRCLIKQVLNEGGNLHIIYTVSDWFDDKRHHNDLVAVVEALGDKANGSCAKLDIKQIYKNQYKICNYDGLEEVIVPDDLDWIVIDF